MGGRLGGRLGGSGACGACRASKTVARARARARAGANSCAGSPAVCCGSFCGDARKCGKCGNHNSAARATDGHRWPLIAVLPYRTQARRSRGIRGTGDHREHTVSLQGRNADRVACVACEGLKLASLPSAGMLHVTHARVASARGWPRVAASGREGTDRGIRWGVPRGPRGAIRYHSCPRAPTQVPSDRLEIVLSMLRKESREGACDVGQTGANLYM